MSGRWEMREGERWTEESWSEPRAGMMIGYSRSGRGETVREFEFIRLEAGADGVPVYLAQPGGRAPVAFRLTRRAKGASATFENPGHDSPANPLYPRRRQPGRDDLGHRRLERDELDVPETVAEGLWRS